MAAVTASSMLEFVRRIFRERRDYGMLTIRQLRTLYTDELKVKHLSSDNREVFASIVTTVFREFENVVDCNDKGQDYKSLRGGDDPESITATYSPSSPRTLPQNGNCVLGQENAKGPSPRNLQLPSAAASSSDSDDDDVIRAVKETLGVRTRKRRPKPVVEPVVLLPCDEASDSDSEGKLMIAESPVSPESPRRPQSDEEGDERLPESERRESRVTTEATTTTEAETLPKVINSSNSPQSPQSEDTKTPPQDSNGKNHKCMDDMPLFTLKLTKTKSGGWVMVRPKSEDSDAGDDAAVAAPRKPPATRRRRSALPRKAKEKTLTVADIFDSSDDEPLSGLRNRQSGESPAAATAKVVAEATPVATVAAAVVATVPVLPSGNGGELPPVPRASPQKRVRKVANNAGGKAPATKRCKPMAKAAASGNPKVPRPKRSIGKPTLKKGRRLKQEKEAEPLQVLGEANPVRPILESRPKRTTRNNAALLDKPVDVPSGPPAEAVAGSEESRRVFSRLKDIIDCENSE